MASKKETTMGVKLIILTHAGGASHGYRQLADALKPGAEVYCHDFPGHGRRSYEPLMDTMSDLVDDLFDKAGILNDQPWAIFGHSMGALLGHAAIKKQMSKKRSLPVAFFVSGALPPSALIKTYISNMTKEMFWSKMSDYGGIPAEVLNNEEIRDYFEILLRKDFAAVESYTPDNVPFDVPLHVFYGLEDRVINDIDKWHQETLGDVNFYPFKGGHFFIFDQIPEVTRIINSIIGSITESAQTKSSVSSLSCH